MDSEQDASNGGAGGTPTGPAGSRSGEALDQEQKPGTRSVDSGYFSQGSIDIPKSKREITSQDRTIITQDASSRSLKSFSGKSFFTKSKQPELLLFPHAPVSDEFFSRFQDLVQLYDRPLKSKLKPKFMAWKVKVLGENENTKRPYIVILCDAESTKKLTKFFSKKEIKQQCEGTAGLPPLPVLVITSAPTRVGSDLADVFGREDVYLDGTNTNCGESIKIVQNGKAKMATMGGIVMASIGGEVRFYGITAGHIVEGDELDDDDDGDDAVSIGSLSDGSESELGSEDESSSETDSISTTASSLEIHVPAEASGCNFGWTRVGQIMKPTAALQDPGGRNLDWSLVELVDKKQKRMNFLKRPPDRENKGYGHWVPSDIDTVYLREHGTFIDRPVLYQPGAEPGYLRGRINTQPAFMHQSPSNKMARVYNMTWDSKWDQVTAGDCGSWVVEPDAGAFGHGNHALYGHIVAVDIFDEAYVVPFEDTMEQLAKYLGAEAIGLPSCSDFLKTEIWTESRQIYQAFPGSSSPSCSCEMDEDFQPFFHDTKNTGALEGGVSASASSDLQDEVRKIEPAFENLKQLLELVDSMHMERDKLGFVSQSIGRFQTREPIPILQTGATSSIDGSTIVPDNGDHVSEPPEDHQKFKLHSLPGRDKVAILNKSGGSTLVSNKRDYTAELREYCKKFKLRAPVYRYNEIAVSNKLDLRSAVTVYIEDILYGASLWNEMHPSLGDACQFACREALRNLAVHHLRLLFEEPAPTGPKLETPTTVVSEATMNKYRQKQLEVLLPRIIEKPSDIAEPVESKLTTATPTETPSEKKRKAKTYEFTVAREQDLPAAERLKAWFVAARKRHPAETIDALLHKQCDLEDQMNEAEYAQESILKELKQADETALKVLAERELIMNQRKALEREVRVLEERVRNIKVTLKHERSKTSVPDREKSVKAVRASYGASYLGSSA
ncbi:hypothetical protein TWF481_004436 [Arthrobotrys musiformis]|uniref:Uncharacterized protein n=1 Tax=Arthrobotrys musiformis TaxID=47236 RepID=A0AAV9WJZ8_9PEZI